jgi:DNA ligase 1
MNRFAHLLDALLLSPSRLTKLRLMKDYFAGTPDPDRGYALAALTGSLAFRFAKPATIRGLVESRVDPVLFGWSYDFVGDLAETAALIWPAQRVTRNAPLHLGEIVETLQVASRAEVIATLGTWFDQLDATGRWALIKLITGGLRVGVSARLAKTALAEMGNVEIAQVEEVWHALRPPYEGLFAWLEGKAPPPSVDTATTFRPIMLSHALEEPELESMNPSDFTAEWKWDGIRVQLVARGGERRIYSRTGDEIAGAFPDIVQALDFDAVLDGELLVRRGDEVAPFNDLQQRLNRKVVTDKMIGEYPAFVRLYDQLYDGDEDLRPLPFVERRARLERWFAANIAGTARLARFDLSPMITFSSWDELREVRAHSATRGSEGVMLKRADSAYLAGRPKGLWFKWKRDAATVDAVMMYAQRGHGKRSSFYSDFTFGCWRDVPGGEELVPVGKAYFGFTDEELLQLDRWVRNHTIERFGPVRAVEPMLVCELAFDGVQASTRHKSGVALRFPRISRIRWDKPAHEADRVETLAAWIEK